jgi:23S rRNA (adenine2503-C2)-methyltransferase
MLKRGGHSLAAVDREAGPMGETVKAALLTHDGHRVECVVIPVPGSGGGRPRTSLCVSTQAGCAMGCAFCETGLLGLARGLGADEIVGQVELARAELGADPTNIVFMGMGEPLDNFDNLAEALDRLVGTGGMGFNRERVTVCTVGLPAGIAALGRLGYKRMNLSVSLNAGTDATRSRIMPVNRAHPLPELMEALAAYPRRRNFVFAFNWCLLPGINDSDAELEAAARLLMPLGRFVINLIPYNPGSRPLARAPTEAEVASFALRCGDLGLPVRVRATRGRGIMAACGQLAGGAVPTPRPRP